MAQKKGILANKTYLIEVCLVFSQNKELKFTYFIS